MNMKKISLATLAGTVLLAAAPVYADNYRGDRHYQRGERQIHHRDRFQRRVVVVQHQAPYRLQRRVVVQRPVMVQRPVVVYRDHSRHDVLGGLIVGAVLGAVIASHGGY